MDFKIILEEDEDGGYVVTVPSLPGCVSQGDTKEEAIKNIKEAIKLHVESLIEECPVLCKKFDKYFEESVVAVPL